MKYDCQKNYAILIKMENFPKDKGKGIKGPNSLFNEKLFDVRLGHLKIWYCTNVIQMYQMIISQRIAKAYSEPNQMCIHNLVQTSKIEFFFDNS